MVKKKSLGDLGSYRKEGATEWFSAHDFQKMLGKRKANTLRAKTPFKTRTLGSHEEYEVTECMLALYLCSSPPIKPLPEGKGKVSERKLLYFLKTMQCHDTVGVYRT